MMVNARNNKIMALRLIGLQTKFSRELRKMIIQAESEPFNKQVYGMEINRVYQMYSSEQLASMATIRMTQK